VRPVPSTRLTRPLARALLGGLALVVLTAAPAAADPAGPSDFRSVVTGIVPTVKGVHAEIRGGDTFLEITVDRGHDVVVDGYQQEPYLHVLPDGTVQRNRRSPATYLNNSRKGKGVVPAEAQDPTAAPVWETVGSDGTYAWHDHRVHWMSEVRPSVPRGQKVGGAYDPWKVPIVVDGTATAVEGTLTYESAATPLPWIAIALVAAAALGWFGRRRAVVAAASALALSSAVAVVVGRADFASTPGGGNPLLWMLPVVALLAAAVALLPRLKGAAVVGTLASVACLSAWTFLRFQVLTKPVLPTSLPFWFDRTTTAAALGLSVAAAYLAVTSGQLHLPALEDD
jgi:hypothetical protein